VTRPAWRKLARDERGGTLIEFAIVAPVMCLFLVGAFDIAHSLYMQSALEGIVQKTGRDSGLESGATTTQQAAIDAKVTSQVKLLANNATLTFARRYYRTFSAAAAARREDFADSTSGIFKNNTCDNGEPYTDANNNGVWDADGGDGGQGGAKDKTVYTVQVTYPRLFPLHGFLPGLSGTQVMKANTVLQNQPYADQDSYLTTNTVRNCP
jgi:Flp pilus assembly protein TadG